MVSIIFNNKLELTVILSVSDTQEPLFGIVKTILCDKYDTLLCVKKCTNVTYMGHLKAWEIQELSETSVVKFDMHMTKQILQLTIIHIMYH